MFLKNTTKLIFATCLLLSSPMVDAYLLTGVTNFSFGTAAAPFNNLIMTDSSICVSAGTHEANSYKLTATSSASGGFKLVNANNSLYTLPYSVSWAAPNSFVSLSSGVASTFNNAFNHLSCPNAGSNAKLQITILGANQMVAPQGSYSDTLTILISAAAD